MQIFLNILLIITIVLGTLLAFGVLNLYVFNKVKINKWIVLAISIVMFLIPFVVTVITNKNYIWVQIVFSILFGISILWFFDLLRSSKYKKKKEEKKIVIKSKPKPNRAKQFKKDNK